jgi:hypothetical protein
MGILQSKGKPWHVKLKPVSWPTKLGLQCKLQALMQHAQPAKGDSLSCSNIWEALHASAFPTQDHQQSLLDR